MKKNADPSARTERRLSLTGELTFDQLLRLRRASTAPAKPKPIRANVAGSGTVVEPAAAIETPSNPTSNAWLATENCYVPNVSVARKLYTSVPQFCQNNVFVTGLVNVCAAVDEPLV